MPSLLLKPGICGRVSTYCSNWRSCTSTLRCARTRAPAARGWRWMAHERNWAVGRSMGFRTTRRYRVDHRVPEEQEVAPSQLRCERDRNGTGHVALREVVDVVVLGDDEAFPFTVRASINLAVQLQDHRALFERQLCRVRVRQVDQTPCSVRADVTELPAVRSGCDVRDDVELFAGVEKGCLERKVVARRHQKLMWHSALRSTAGNEAKNRWIGVGVASASSNACSSS